MNAKTQLRLRNLQRIIFFFGIFAGLEWLGSIILSSGKGTGSLGIFIALLGVSGIGEVLREEEGISKYKMDPMTFILALIIFSLMIYKAYLWFHHS